MFQFGVLNFVREAKPTKTPWQRDWADCGQKPKKVQIILFS